MKAINGHLSFSRAELKLIADSNLVIAELRVLLSDDNSLKRALDYINKETEIFADTWIYNAELTKRYICAGKLDFNTDGFKNDSLFKLCALRALCG